MYDLSGKPKDPDRCGNWWGWGYSGAEQEILIQDFATEK